MLVNLIRMFFAIILLGGFVACSSSLHVSNSSLIQKRKYQSGFHIVSRSKNTPNLSTNSNLKNPSITALKDTLAITKDLTSDIENVNDQIIVSEFKGSTANNLDKIGIVNSSANLVVTKKSNVGVHNIGNQKIKHDKRLNENIIKRHALKKLTTTTKKSSKSVEIDAYMLLLIILACIIPPLAVLLYTDVDWKKVAIALILCLFFYFPAIIYALLVLFDVL